MKKDNDTSLPAPPSLRPTPHQAIIFLRHVFPAPPLLRPTLCFFEISKIVFLNYIIQNIYFYFKSYNLKYNFCIPII